MGDYVQEWVFPAHPLRGAWVAQCCQCWCPSGLYGDVLLWARPVDIGKTPSLCDCFLVCNESAKEKRAPLGPTVPYLPSTGLNRVRGALLCSASNHHALGKLRRSFVA